MDFIEQIFGFSPDGGDGSLEFLLVAAFLAIPAGVIAWCRHARKAATARRDRRTT